MPTSIPTERPIGELDSLPHLSFPAQSPHEFTKRASVCQVTGIEYAKKCLPSGKTKRLKNAKDKTGGKTLRTPSRGILRRIGIICDSCSF